MLDPKTRREQILKDRERKNWKKMQLSSDGIIFGGYDEYIEKSVLIMDTPEYRKSKREKHLSTRFNCVNEFIRGDKVWMQLDYVLYVGQL